MTTLQNKIAFAIKGSFVDLIDRSRIGVWSCPSPRYIEKMDSGGISLQPIVSQLPAIDESGAFLIEPSDDNLVTYNLDLSQTVWQKGSNVFVTSDSIAAPDSGFFGDSITFASSALGGETQILRRELLVEAAGTYEVFWLLQLKLGSGKLAAKDVARITDDQGNVLSEIKLSALNDFQGRWQKLRTQFTAQGNQPELPVVSGGISLTNVTATTVTISASDGLAGIGIDDLVGGQITFSENAATSYEIVANDAAIGQTVIVTVQTTSLITDGITTASEVLLTKAPKVTVRLELYCESTATIAWGGVHLSEFANGIIYQAANRQLRSAADLSFQHKDNPVVGLSSFGVYLSVSAWRGDGNLADFGDFKISILNGMIRASAGTTIVAGTTALPSSFDVFVQTNPENSSLSLYVNQVLVARQSIAGFTPSLKPVIFTSTGSRTIKSVLVFTPALTDGSIDVGAIAQQEVAELFMDDPVPSSLIASHDPGFALAQVTINGVPDPSVSTAITAINTGTKVVTVSNGTGFSNGNSIQVFRGANRVGYFVITTVSGNNLTLDSVTGLNAGDVVILGEIEAATRTFCRFPFVPFIKQKILVVDSGNSRVQVSAALGFSKQRSFISTALYQDIAEVLISNVDGINNWLTVSNTDSIEVGHYIAQPFSELTIAPANYFVRFLEGNTGVVIEQKTSNGVVISNLGKTPKTVTPFIEVAL